MDISSLKIIKAVADEGSVSKAALRLYCVQSNVTTRVRQLEDELDTRLFYRKKRGMVLTPSGKILLEYANHVIELLEEAEKAVKDTESVKGPLSIGSMETTASVRLPSVLSNYHREYPQVDLTFVTGTSEELIQMVLDYRLDGAFVGGPVEHSEIVQETMFNEELVIISDKKVKSINSLKIPTAIVFRKGCTYRAMLENWFIESGFISFKVMELGTLEGILGCVSAGIGITLLPHSVITHLKYNKEINVHRIPNKMKRMSTIFICGSDTIITKALEAFLNMAKQKEENFL